MGNFCTSINKSCIDLAADRTEIDKLENSIKKKNAKLIKFKEASEKKLNNPMNKFDELQPKFGSTKNSSRKRSKIEEVPIENIENMQADLEKVEQVKMASKNRRKSKFADIEALNNLAEIAANIPLKSNQSLNTHNEEAKHNARRFDSILNFTGQASPILQKIDIKNLYNKIPSRNDSMDVCVNKI